LPPGSTPIIADPSTDDENATDSTIKDEIDAYGVGVRAGVITPQPEDEAAIREKLSLPAATEAVRKAWAEDGGVRRPITIRDENAVAGVPSPNPNTPVQDGEE